MGQLNKEIEQLIEQLDLKPHPEGGYYKETYRSIENTNGNRSLMTSIYFLLTSDNVSHFHKIKSDEHWFYHAGDSLTVHLLNENGHEELKLGPNFENGEAFHHIVPKNTIFGSSIEKENGFSLVSCVVAPGFDFEDFELLNSTELLRHFPDEKEIITKLTFE
jgi:predicted cupin superfamily sugar epimerase